MKEKKTSLLYKRKYEFDINAFINNKFFGRYPQTKVTDPKIISVLKYISNINEFGYMEYENNEYLKCNGNYYLVEPIKWKVLESTENSYKLVSDVILDCKLFYNNNENRIINNNTIYANNYEYSNIRAWLNGYDGSSYGINNYTNKGFVDIAFNGEERKIILQKLVDNSASTTVVSFNKFICNNTCDKAYLLSYKDVYQYFVNDDERKTKVSDYSKANDIYNNNGYGQFWLRSPSYDNSFDTNYVDLLGCVDDIQCYFTYISVLPVIEISLEKKK